MGSATEAWDDSGTAPGVPSDPTSAESPLFVLDETVDNVGIAMQPLAAGDVVSYGGTSLNVRTAVPVRHKIALVEIDAGETVHKLGLPPAQRAAASPASGTGGAWRPGVETELTSFLGYVRPNGSVGTRNYI